MWSSNAELCDEIRKRIREVGTVFWPVASERIQKLKYLKRNSHRDQRVVFADDIQRVLATCKLTDKDEQPSYTDFIALGVDRCGEELVVMGRLPNAVDEPVEVKDFNLPED